MKLSQDALKRITAPASTIAVGQPADSLTQSQQVALAVLAGADFDVSLRNGEATLTTEPVGFHNEGDRIVVTTMQRSQ